MESSFDGIHRGSSLAIYLIQYHYRGMINEIFWEKVAKYQNRKYDVYSLGYFIFLMLLEFGKNGQISQE